MGLGDSHSLYFGICRWAHPYPMMVREFHAVIGKETRKQALEKWGGKPEVLVACVGPLIYLKREDLNHTGPHKINNAIAQALLACVGGGKHSATLTKAWITLELDLSTYSFLKDEGRAEYYCVTDEEALEDKEQESSALHSSGPSSWQHLIKWRIP
ncbi:hypothetical protein QYF36_010566 [Acer negundo]|nr:hypothetical protein QYF36_010566 [Acer negundo]